MPIIEDLIAETTKVPVAAGTLVLPAPERALPTLTVADLLAALAAVPLHTVQVIWPDGEPIEAHFHVTEVGRVQKDFLDCGGTLRRQVTCLLQTWVGEDVDHRLLAGKLHKALQRSAAVLGSVELPVEFEYEACNVVQLRLVAIQSTDDLLQLQLAAKHTDCLAKDLCVPAAKTNVGQAVAPGASTCCGGDGTGCGA